MTALGPSTRELGDIAYREMAFQSIYAHRQGHRLPKDKDKAQLVPDAVRTVERSKALLAIMLIFLALGSMALLLNPVVRPGGTTLQYALAPYVPVPIFDGAVIGGLLLIELSLVWTTGLQLLPTYLSSRIVPLFETLPIPDWQKDRIALYVILRLFNYSILTILFVVPFAVGAGLHSWAAGFATFGGCVAAVILGLALALYTGGFFVRNVQGARGGFFRAVARWVYILLWAIPAIAIYGFIAFAPGILALFTSLAGPNGSPAWTATVSVFPLPYAYLPVVIALPNGLPGVSPVLLVLAAVAYIPVFVYIALWLIQAPRRLALTVPRGEGRPIGESPPIRPSSQVVAVLKKDLTTASRTPAFAFILLLPILSAFVIGLASFVGASSTGASFGFGAGAVTTAAGFSVFFGPAFLATEVMGYSYTQTLPLKDRSLMFGKVAMISGVFLGSAALILGMLALRLSDPARYLEFIGAELPAILAAAFIEVGLLFHIASKSALPVTNLFTGTYAGMSVIVPGVFLALTPLYAFFQIDNLPGAPSDWALPVMALLSLVSFAGALPIALSTAKGGGPP